MKRILSLLLVCVFLTQVSPVFALDETVENISTVKEPVWEEYVAPKYRHPRKDFSRGGAIAECVLGDLLIGLILTAPVGIPLAVHGVTKIKMISYANRKEIFDEEIMQARLIEDDAKRAEEYQRILKKCHLKESTRLHYEKKRIKAQKKAECKASK